eukprot:jgi/Mesvir1/20981/Mv08047-RA.1
MQQEAYLEAAMAPGSDVGHLQRVVSELRVAVLAGRRGEENALASVTLWQRRHQEAEQRLQQCLDRVRQLEQGEALASGRLHDGSLDLLRGQALAAVTEQVAREGARVAHAESALRAMEGLLEQARAQAEAQAAAHEEERDRLALETAQCRLLLQGARRDVATLEREKEEMATRHEGQLQAVKAALEAAAADASSAKEQGQKLKAELKELKFSAMEHEQQLERAQAATARWQAATSEAEQAAAAAALHVEWLERRLQEMESQDVAAMASHYGAELARVREAADNDIRRLQSLLAAEAESTEAVRRQEAASSSRLRQVELDLASARQELDASRRAVEELRAQVRRREPLIAPGGTRDDPQGGRGLGAGRAPGPHGGSDVVTGGRDDSHSRPTANTGGTFDDHGLDSNNGYSQASNVASDASPAGTALALPSEACCPVCRSLLVFDERGGDWRPVGVPGWPQGEGPRVGHSLQEENTGSWGLFPDHASWRAKPGARALGRGLSPSSAQENGMPSRSLGTRSLGGGNGDGQEREEVRALEEALSVERAQAANLRARLGLAEGQLAVLHSQGGGYPPGRGFEDGLDATGGEGVEPLSIRPGGEGTGHDHDDDRAGESMGHGQGKARGKGAVGGRKRGGRDRVRRDLSEDLLAASPRAARRNAALGIGGGGGGDSGEGSGGDSGGEGDERQGGVGSGIYGAWGGKGSRVGGGGLGERAEGGGDRAGEAVTADGGKPWERLLEAARDEISKLKEVNEKLLLSQRKDSDASRAEWQVEADTRWEAKMRAEQASSAAELRSLLQQNDELRRQLACAQDASREETLQAEVDIAVQSALLDAGTSAEHRRRRQVARVRRAAERAAAASLAALETSLHAELERSLNEELTETSFNKEPVETKLQEGGPSSGASPLVFSGRQREAREDGVVVWAGVGGHVGALSRRNDGMGGGMERNAVRGHADGEGYVDDSAEASAAHWFGGHDDHGGHHECGGSDHEGRAVSALQGRNFVDGAGINDRHGLALGGGDGGDDDENEGDEVASWMAGLLRHVLLERARGAFLAAYASHVGAHLHGARVRWAMERQLACAALLEERDAAIREAEWARSRLQALEEARWRAQAVEEGRRRAQASEEVRGRLQTEGEGVCLQGAEEARGRLQALEGERVAPVGRGADVESMPHLKALEQPNHHLQAFEGVRGEDGAEGLSREHEAEGVGGEDGAQGGRGEDGGQGERGEDGAAAEGIAVHLDVAPGRAEEVVELKGYSTGKDVESALASRLADLEAKLRGQLEDEWEERMRVLEAMHRERMAEVEAGWGAVAGDSSQLGHPGKWTIQRPPADHPGDPVGSSGQLIAPPRVAHQARDGGVWGALDEPRSNGHHGDGTRDYGDADAGRLGPEDGSSEWDDAEPGGSSTVILVTDTLPLPLRRSGRPRALRRVASGGSGRSQRFRRSGNLAGPCRRTAARSRVGTATAAGQWGTWGGNGGSGDVRARVGTVPAEPNGSLAVIGVSNIGSEAVPGGARSQEPESVAVGMAPQGPWAKEPPAFGPVSVLERASGASLGTDTSSADVSAVSSSERGEGVDGDRSAGERERGGENGGRGDGGRGEGSTGDWGRGGSRLERRADGGEGGGHYPGWDAGGAADLLLSTVLQDSQDLMRLHERLRQRKARQANGEPSPSASPLDRASGAELLPSLSPTLVDATRPTRHLVMEHTVHRGTGGTGGLNSSWDSQVVAFTGTAAGGARPGGGKSHGHFEGFQHRGSSMDEGGPGNLTPVTWSPSQSPGTRPADRAVAGAERRPGHARSLSEETGDVGSVGYVASIGLAREEDRSGTRDRWRRQDARYSAPARANGVRSSRRGQHVAGAEDGVADGRSSGTSRHIRGSRQGAGAEGSPDASTSVDVAVPDARGPEVGPYLTGPTSGAGVQHGGGYHSRARAKRVLFEKEDGDVAQETTVPSRGLPFVRQAEAGRGGVAEKERTRDARLLAAVQPSSSTAVTPERTQNAEMPQNPRVPPRRVNPSGSVNPSPERPSPQGGALSLDADEGDLALRVSRLQRERSQLQEEMARKKAQAVALLASHVRSRSVPGTGVSPGLAHWGGRDVGSTVSILLGSTAAYPWLGMSP